MRFESKVVVVTGAARGQGRSHALGFAAEGADVVVADICQDFKGPSYSMGTEEQLNSVAAEIEKMGRRALPLKVDVRSETDMARLIETTVEEFGGVDVMVNNAGFLQMAAAHELSEEDWDATIDTMLKGVYFGSRFAGLQMVRQGRGGVICSTSSGGGLKGFGMMAHYVAAKHGVIGLTRALAVELAPANIRVNAICPGHVRTNMLAGSAADAGMSPDELYAFLKRTILMPAEDLLEPVDITRAYLWVCSDEARYVTGTEIVVDQGFLQKSATG